MNVDTDRTDQGGGTGGIEKGKNEVSRELRYPFITRRDRTGSRLWSGYRKVVPTGSAPSTRFKNRMRLAAPRLPTSCNSSVAASWSAVVPAMTSARTTAAARLVPARPLADFQMLAAVDGKCPMSAEPRSFRRRQDSRSAGWEFA